MLKILVAPSAYKGYFSSLEIASAIKAALEQTHHSLEISCLPLADGGDGSIEAVYTTLGGHLYDLDVIGPLNKAVNAKWLLINDWAFVELANSCGMTTIKNKPLKPMTAHTYGLGQVIKACLTKSVSKMLIGLGGSASTDGGMGALSALGVKFFDYHGQILLPGGGSLGKLASIDMAGIDKRIKKTEIEILTDVNSTLLGSKGSAALFAAQKGATKNEVMLLETGLLRLSQVIEEIIDKNLKNVPGTGAAGGTAFGLASLTGAKIVSGFDKIASLIKLEEAIKHCDLIISGEGKLDSQFFMGKATGKLAYLCKKFAKPLVVFPALVEDKILWRELGIKAVYPTIRNNKISSLDNIKRTVKDYIGEHIY